MILGARDAYWDHPCRWSRSSGGSTFGAPHRQNRRPCWPPPQTGPPLPPPPSPSMVPVPGSEHSRRRSTGFSSSPRDRAEGEDGWREGSGSVRKRRWADGKGKRRIGHGRRRKNWRRASSWHRLATLSPAIFFITLHWRRIPFLVIN